MKKSRGLKRILAYVLSLAMLAGVAEITGVTPEPKVAEAAGGENWSGSGTAADPWQITGAADLGTLSAKVAAGNNYAGKFFKITGGEIGISGVEPIGNDGTGFAGTFDGNGQKITITLKRMSSKIGLFGVLRDTATVKNLEVVGDIEGSSDVGIIAGINYGTIEDCTISGKVKGGNYTGAIAGTNGKYDGTSGGQIKNCINTATVTGTGKWTGGIAGYNKGGIVNCTNNANIDVTGGGEYTGGITGYNSGSINNCLNRLIDEDKTGDTEKSIIGQASTGGIAGKNTGSITNCTNQATVTTDDEKTGGIAGSGEGEISGCLNTGAVKGIGKSLVGGIAGEFEGTKEGAKIASCTNRGEVTGASVIGGIAGKLKNATIDNCVNEGALTAPEGEQNNRGGIVGETDAATVKSCTNTTALTGNENIGGIVGKMTNGGMIDNCLNSGKNEGTKHIGGIVGDASGEIYSCTNSAGIKGKEDVGGIVGLTTKKVEGCINTGKIENTATTNDKLFENTGGIVGKGNGATGCTNKGKVFGYYDTGGIIGENLEGGNGINGCRNEGNVGYPEAYAHKPNYIGGIAGTVARSGVSECVNTAVVSGGSRIGGIVGYVSHADVLDCYNNGSVHSYDSSIINITGGGTPSVSLAGGIVGYILSGYIKRSANKGSVTAVSDCSGGIVGYLDGTDGEFDEDDGGTVGGHDAGVEKCYNRGYVQGHDYVGGLVGMIGYWQRVITSYNYSPDPIADESLGNVGKLIGGVDKQPSWKHNGRTLHPIFHGVRNCVFTDTNFDPVGWDKLNLSGDYHYLSNKKMKDGEAFDSINKKSEKNGVWKDDFHEAYKMADWMTMEEWIAHYGAAISFIYHWNMEYMTEEDKAKWEEYQKDPKPNKWPNESGETYYQFVERVNEWCIRHGKPEAVRDVNSIDYIPFFVYYPPYR